MQLPLALLVFVSTASACLQITGQWYTKTNWLNALLNDNGRQVCFSQGYRVPNSWMQLDCIPGYSAGFVSPNGDPGQSLELQMWTRGETFRVTVNLKNQRPGTETVTWDDWVFGC